MRNLIFLLLLISPALLADTARIATWNLGGFHRIPQHKLDNIIEGLKLLKADLVVLSELNPLSHGEVIAQELSKQPGECYKATVLDQPRASQEIGFLYKCDVMILGSEIIDGSDLGKRGYRNAMVLHARINNFDFVVVGLHLKAGRGRTNRSLRDEQLAVLNGYIQGVLMAGEKDVIVIGDYNMIPGKDDDNFDMLNMSGSLRYISSEELSGQGSHVGSHGIGNLLDGFAFTNVDEAEYQNGTLNIVQMHDKLGLSLSDYKSSVTDHLPLVADFETSTDHD